MPDTSEDKQDRLSRIWTDWGLRVDTPTGDALQVALGAADSWLQKGSSDPEIVIRAVQVLLVDPERPDAHKRNCWGSLRKAIRGAWGNAMTAPDHVLLGQSLVLAAWPQEIQGRWFDLARLLDSAWDVLAGRDRQQNEMTRWREENQVRLMRDVGKRLRVQQSLQVTPNVSVDIAPVTSALVQFEQNQTTNRFDNAAPYLLAVFVALKDTLSTLSNALQSMSGDMSTVIKRTQEDSDRIRVAMCGVEGELNLLWWGQARYCETLRKPFRRIEHPEDVVWWAACEAADRARDIDVEPAAAYLVETLHDLGQDIFEKRPLLRWMEELHASLKRAAQLAPALSDRLERYAREDALGLPVTWVRLRAAQNESLEGAVEKVALDLNAEIDRGQWASWIFRERLLDLYLVGDS